MEMCHGELMQMFLLREVESGSFVNYFYLCCLEFLPPS